MEISHLTNAEEQLMHLFWELQSFYLKDVMEKHPEPKPHQNTISTYLKILVEKKFLSTTKEGRIFKYTTEISKNDYRKYLIQNILRDYYSNSSQIMVSSLMEEKIVATSDFQNLIKVKTTVVPVVKESPKKENPIADFIEEITSPKKEKDKKKKKKEKEKDKKKKKS